LTAVLAVMMVFIVRLEMRHILGSRAPFLLFTLSVMVSAWYGGVGPGLLATVLGTVAGFSFLRHPFDHRFGAGEVDWLQFVISILIGVAISILSESMHAARTHAERNAQALYASEERYRRMVETANEGIWLSDQNARTTFVNQSMADMLGCAPEEMSGRPLTDFVFEEDQADAIALLARRRKGVGDTLDVRLRRSDGREVWTLFSASPVFGDRGEYIGALAMVSDVSERRRANEALRESEHQLKLSLRAANAATLEWNLATRKMSWSDHYYRLLGAEPGGFEPSADTWIDRIHPDDRERVRAAMIGAAEHRSDVNIEYRIVRSGGVIRWVNTRGQIFCDARGRAERMLGVVLDITERKKIEREREKIRVREQAARAREEIAKAEAARKSQEFKSAILDSVAHDMKTPLTSIKAAVTCLLGKKLELRKPIAELLSVIDEETDRLTRMATEAIDAARLEVGKLTLQKGPHNVRETISAALEEVKPKTLGRRVLMRLPEAVAPADIDFQMVKQVFKQLLENALKYSPAGSPLTISCRSSGNTIETEVADLGPGIPEEEQMRIFEEFYRVPGGQGHTTGMGMGLFIAKRIVDAHGGKIWVTSKPGSGSAFHVSLPVYGRSLS
jgi:PAS domain S-box-containing protein